MERTQTWALVVLLAGTFVGVGVIVISGGSLQVVQEGSFRASPGSQRSRAQPLVTPEGAEGDAEGSPASARTEPPPAATGDDSDPASSESAGPLVPPALPSEELSAAARAMREARNALNPETGVERLERHLRSLQNLGEASEVYSAMARLYLQTDPPQAGRAAEAVEAALTHARDARERDQARYVEVEMLRTAGRNEEAQAKAEALLSEEGPVTAGKIKMAMSMAQLRQQQGETAKAETAYRRAMADALSAQEALGPQAMDFYRQAGLNLVLLLRGNDRREEAEALAAEVERRLTGSEE